MLAMIKNIAANQRGAISVLTLVFMLLIGVIIIIFLWTIAVLTGAYNTLYIANQNAANAAAGAASTEELQGAQLGYLCQSPGQPVASPSSTACSLPTNSPGDQAQLELENAGAVFAARKVMRETLRNRPFGLRFTGADKNVQLIPEPWVTPANNREYVLLYNVALSKGEISSRLAAGASCQIPSGRFYGRLSDSPPGSASIHCWQVKEDGMLFAQQYNSGVITRARAQIELFPNCPAIITALCGRQEITVNAAATLRQPPSSSSWEDFYYLTNP
jgi:hypothetical protein